ncbi:MAG TPA: hypothetical protein RMH85_07070 [Polyangiaceae bacterium LLY-WYZ-15_(1-7)]|nr:hypothetical protein [Myxococcales bacterium]MAT28655.1 hypothetical protein [Sandaracinus sp.]HJL05213.1 hypothetical protein [Polyangiaceae bacterium LLY-WYZ-15_(1-7)]MBJ73254.1 hypothetical protein [Sandaracinus sp.]HJL08240.1 hypothetical protein [Polyangiaceae bacterium LLY-WYZ-15_(1-7)]
MNKLARYLIEHIYLDFDGGITIDQVREFLRDEDSRESRALLAKLIEDKGVDDMMITVAEVLKDYLRTGINEEVLREQLRMYSES